MSDSDLRPTFELLLLQHSQIASELEIARDDRKGEVINKGVGRKFSRGGANGKKDRKLAKNTEK